MSKSLIIVESPTKARTLSRFLGDGYRIEATMGHIRDLPEKKLGVEIQESKQQVDGKQEEPHTADLPAQAGRIPCTVHYTFTPTYVVSKEKKKRVAELKKLAESADRVILATDPDREGEAIAWHVAEVLGVTGKRSAVSSKENNNKPPTANRQLHTFSRIVFHEITKSAIEEALSHPRMIDMPLVDAQQARRVLDRIVGYKVSPLLWNKLGKRWLSAGRVQSVAVRLIVEREREIKAFVPEEYWLVEVELCKQLAAGSMQLEHEEKLLTADRLLPTQNSFVARLVKIGEEKVEVKDKDTADQIVADLKQAPYRVSRVDTKETRRQPAPPFTTSTLQQAGANRFGWSAKRTMQTAQRLYEEGYITYHRTDSTNLSDESIQMVRSFIPDTYGVQYLPDVPRLYKTKSKVAQEAHEAIRPTHLDASIERKVEEVLGRDAQRLYQLIFNRFVACQMREAIFDQTSVDIQAISSKQMTVSSKQSKEEIRNTNEPPTANRLPLTYVLRANGQVMKFDGWTRVFEDSKAGKVKEEGDEKEQKEEERLLPPLSVEESLDLVQLLPQQKFTEPPPRYNEASLIKTLEQAGIGRPSTYAPIISTIQDRKYVEKIERRFHATDLGMAVSDFLVLHFPDIFDVAFTAKMEDELDSVANGQLPWNSVMNEFYGPLASKIDTVFKDAVRVKVDLGESGESCPDCGHPLVYRLSKYGKFLACSNFPECKFTKTIIEKTGIPCPKCGGDMILKKTRKGKQFYGCANYPTCTFAAWKKEDIK